MQVDLGPSLPTLKAAAARRVDEAAEAARLRYITGGSGQAMEYQRGEQEAVALLTEIAAGATPDPADYPMVVAEWAAILAATDATPTLADVANEIASLSLAWRGVGASIKQLRRTAKLRVEAAATPAEVAAASSGIAWP